MCLCNPCCLLQRLQLCCVVALVLHTTHVHWIPRMKFGYALDPYCRLSRLLSCLLHFCGC